MLKQFYSMRSNFLSSKFKNFIDVENQKNDIDYLNENDFMLINENKSQNKLSNQAFTFAKKFSKRIQNDQFFIKIINKRNF